ncbi:MAG: YlxR family protein [Ruminococcaceae bacterium]|nr:YlxR family protein [Oscillospiraceae bacterium]
MQKKKAQPMRKCTGCNEMKEKRELVRIVRDPEGNISVDLTGKKSGRGAYICRDKKCLNAAKRAKRLDRAFECTVPDEVYERLEGELSE